MTPTGASVGQWNVTGKVDGLTADPNTGTVIATANEDLNSSLYETIRRVPARRSTTRTTRRCRTMEGLTPSPFSPGLGF